MISIIGRGIERIRRSLSRLIPQATDDVTLGTAKRVLDYAQRSADLHTKTGALVRSLRMQRRGPGRYSVGHDERIAPHWRFVHWGTKPHIIRPKNRKVLRWVSGGKFVFAKIVRHPGYIGDPYLERARNVVARSFDQIARDAWERTRRAVL